MKSPMTSPRRHEKKSGRGSGVEVICKLSRTVSSCTPNPYGDSLVLERYINESFFGEEQIKKKAPTYF